MSRYLPMTTKERVVNAIITSLLDYCNSLLYGTCVNNIARLQRMHNSAPKYLCDLVCPYTPTRVLRSANNNMLTVQRTHVKAGDCTFTGAAATLWNTLPIDIKMSDTLHFQGTPKDSLL